MDEKIENGIKKVRESKGISILELATLLKVEPSVLKGWESGAAFPSLNMLIEMKKILDVSSDMLLLSESRKALDISKLREDQKQIVIDLYKKIKLM